MAVGTTRGKRRLGRFVKQVRLRSGLDVGQVSALAECARQTVTRMESGDSLPGIHLFLAILGVIGATDQERVEARQLREVADVDTASIEYAEDLSAKYRRFRLDELEASRERTLDLVIVPGMLQTPDYAAALYRGRHLRNKMPEWESRAATERQNRQELLKRKPNPLELHALVDQAVLERVIGGPSVMAAQFDHLLQAAKTPNVTIQVIRKNHGAHGAMSGPLTVFSFPEDDEPDAAYIESLVATESVENEDVAALSAVWEEVAAAAPSSAKSTEIIRAARAMVMKR